jgi:hypothetical protein
MRVGDEVRFVHSPGLGGIISSIADGAAMVCMPIGHSYQLRGPVPLADLAPAYNARQA